MDFFFWKCDKTTDHLNYTYSNSNLSAVLHTSFPNTGPQQQANQQVICCLLYITAKQTRSIWVTIFKHVRKARAFSHLIPHLHSCRFSSPVLSWTIAMFSLGVGPWTGEATQQEVETWVLCYKSIVSVFMLVLFLCAISVFCHLDLPSFLSHSLRQQCSFADFLIDIILL